MRRVLQIMAGMLIATFLLFGANPLVRARASATQGSENVNTHGVSLESHSPDLDFEAAEKAVAGEGWREAQLHLAKLLIHQPGHTRGLFLMLRATQREMSQQMGQGQYLVAVQRLTTAQEYFARYCEHHLSNNSGPQAMRNAYRAEQHLEELETWLRARAAVEAKSKLSRAQEHADDSYRYLWFNDRSAVREGLRQLRWVQEHIEYLDADQRGEFFRLLGVLKRRVSDKEWEQIVAEAGIGMMGGQYAGASSQ